MKTRSIVLSILLLVTIVPMLTAQAYRIESNVNGRGAGRRPNVLKELKLSRAQREEIASIASSLQNDTRTQRRKLEVLKEDYALACVQDKVDEKELKRIQSDMQLTRLEINEIAMKKMSEIKSLLSTTQTQKLAELRSGERQRLETAQQKKKADISLDNAQRDRIPSMQSFTMHSWSSSTDNQNTFNPDEVFTYPDRDLWLDNATGSAFSFSSNEGDDDGAFGGFNQFFGGNGGGSFNFQMPQLQPFLERQQQGEQGDGDSDTMEPTPHSLPKPKAPGNSANQEKLRQQLNDLKEQLKKLQKQFEDDQK